jgi:glutaredoxin
MTHKKVELYYFPECPFCKRVLDYLETAPYPLTYKNTSETPAYKQELISIGGKTQVPCLIIDGRPLYESLDIIAWLKNNR